LNVEKPKNSSTPFTKEESTSGKKCCGVFKDVFKDIGE
jgi:hypothetical protein